jgi:hypothetical protein
MKAILRKAGMAIFTLRIEEYIARFSITQRFDVFLGMTNLIWFASFHIF